jgi:hypothetical protein
MSGVFDGPIVQFVGFSFHVLVACKSRAATLYCFTIDVEENKPFRFPLATHIQSFSRHSWTPLTQPRPEGATFLWS